MLLVLVAFTTPAAAGAELYFEPDPSSVPVGEIVTIQLMANITSPVDGLRAAQIGIAFDPSVVNITSATNPIKLPGWGAYPPIYWWDDVFTCVRNCGGTTGPLGEWVWIFATSDVCHDGPIVMPVANITIKGTGPGTSPLQITHEYLSGPTGLSLIFNCSSKKIASAVWNDGTIESELTECLGDCYELANCGGEITATNVPCYVCLNATEPLGLSWNRTYRCPDRDMWCPDACFDECPTCCDGIDNDGDGLTDCPADDGCACCCDATETIDETTPCVPELATVTFVSVGLLGLIGAIWRRRYD